MGKTEEHLKRNFHLSKKSLMSEFTNTNTVESDMKNNSAPKLK